MREEGWMEESLEEEEGERMLDREVDRVSTMELCLLVVLIWKEGSSLEGGGWECVEDMEEERGVEVSLRVEEGWMAEGGEEKERPPPLPFWGV